MKPQIIYLIRHGESQGNVNQELYKEIPDWKIELTEKGHQQAVDMAESVLDDVMQQARLVWGPQYNRNNSRDMLSLYCSPWARTRQTAKPLENKFNIEAYEDPRIREQEWGNYAEDEHVVKISRERKKFGTFYYRMPNGESGADVYDRVTGFIDTLHRDFAKKDYPLTAAIVSHGLAIKAFLMRWFHWPAEDFDLYKTPQNCEILKMVLGNNHKYHLSTPLRRRAHPEEDS